MTSEIDVAYAGALHEIDKTLNVVNAVGEDFVRLASGDRVMALPCVIQSVNPRDLIVPAITKRNNCSIFIDERLRE